MVVTFGHDEVTIGHPVHHDCTAPTFFADAGVPSSDDCAWWNIFCRWRKTLSWLNPFGTTENIHSVAEHPSVKRPLKEARSTAPSIHAADGRMKSRHEIASEYEKFHEEHEKARLDDVKVVQDVGTREVTQKHDTANRILTIHPSDPILFVRRKVQAPPVSPEIWKDTTGQAIRTRAYMDKIDKLEHEAADLKSNVVKDMTKMRYVGGRNGNPSIYAICKDIAKIRDDIQTQVKRCKFKNASFMLQLTGVPADADIDLPRMWCANMNNKLKVLDSMVNDTCNGHFTMSLGRDEDHHLTTPVSVAVTEPPVAPHFDFNEQE